MANPMSRARTREAAGLHKLRQGREQCYAFRRDGQRCEAPAIKGGLVCRRHGGSAPQVQIAAKHRLLMEANFTAACAYWEAKGTPAEFDALCRWSAVERDLKTYRLKLQRLAGLRAALKRLKAAEKAP